MFRREYHQITDFLAKRINCPKAITTRRPISPLPHAVQQQSFQPQQSTTTKTFDASRTVLTNDADTGVSQTLIVLDFAITSVPSCVALIVPHSSGLVVHGYRLVAQLVLRHFVSNVVWSIQGVSLLCLRKRRPGTAPELAIAWHESVNLAKMKN